MFVHSKLELSLVTRVMFLIVTVTIVMYCDVQWNNVWSTTVPNNSLQEEGIFHVLAGFIIVFPSKSYFGWKRKVNTSCSYCWCHLKEVGPSIWMDLKSYHPFYVVSSLVELTCSIKTKFLTTTNVFWLSIPTYSGEGCDPSFD